MATAPMLASPPTDDFSPVVAALREFSATTGRLPALLGGWEVADGAITPPPALARHLRAVPSQPFAYTYSRDFRVAREEAAALFSRNTRIVGEMLTPDQVAILPNSSQGLFLALTALRETGIRRVVIAAPTYYGAVAACRHLGLATIFVPTADYLTGALNVPAIAAALRQPDAALLLTNPAYSLGVEYTPDELRALFAALPSHAPILLDETRLGIAWKSDQPWYGLDFPSQVMILRSPSKIFFLNGAKMSVLIAPPHLVRLIERISEALLGSVAGNAEAVALAYLAAWSRWWAELDADRLGPMRRWKRGVVRAFRQHLAEMQSSLAPYGGACSPVDSGPYALVGFPTRQHPPLDSERIAREQGVLLMTSNYFYHEYPDWQGFRINLAGCAIQAREGVTRVFEQDPRMLQ